MTDNGVAWSIVAQREEMQMGPAGAFVPGMVVAFRTGSGATGSVFVPMTDYTVERVRTLVSERAAVMESVATLANG